jgi:hypothetical protein
VAADTRVSAVRPQDHRHRVPSDQTPDPSLKDFVPRKERLLLGTDGVDIPSLGQGRQADVKLASPLEDLVEQVASALVAFLAVNLVEGVQPLLRFCWIDVRQLVLELVDVHSSVLLQAEC